MPDKDIWSDWILEKRFGGDKEAYRQTMDALYVVMENVLKKAGLQSGETLLDVGCGDGLIGFGALEKVPGANVIFSDISEHLLEEVRNLAEKKGVASQCRFICNHAEDLKDIGEASVDVVALRSVLIYTHEKEQAFREFYRVLNKGGRLSIFEPVNNYFDAEPEHRFYGYDVKPVMQLAAKVKEGCSKHAPPPEEDPMMAFISSDLVEYADLAGFRDIHLTLKADVNRIYQNVPWEVVVKTAPNPRAPTLDSILRETLTDEERITFNDYMAKKFENDQAVTRQAVAYLEAEKA